MDVSIFDEHPLAADLLDRESTVSVPIPALVIQLQMRELQNGASLDEEEALEIRNKARYFTIPASEKAAMDRNRGYQDIDPLNVWQEWLMFKARDRR
jgi:hypothetical protein